MKMNELDDFERENLASLLREAITKHREEARLSHVAGEITQSQLDWHLSHAQHLEGIAKKLFPGWGT